jgi:HEAT repeat protein
MTKRRAAWLVVLFVLLAGLALLVPGSPLYLPGFFLGEAQYEGHSAAQWRQDLASADGPTRTHAAFVLGAIGRPARAAVPALAHALTDDPDAHVRREAAMALFKMAPDSAAAVPALAHGLEDQEPFVRAYSAMALLELKAESRPAVPELIRAVQDEANETNLKTFTFTVRGMAARALGRASAGTDDGVPALTDLLTSAHSDRTRLDAIRALGEVGTEAAPAVLRLRALLDAKNDAIRGAARETLDAIEKGPAGSQEHAANRPAGEARQIP